MALLKNKLKGFTIIELLVSLILSSLVLLSCFSLYIITAKTNIIYEKILAENEIKILFFGSLYEDFERSDYIRADEDVLHFIFQNDSCLYMFDQGRVIKAKEKMSDTFYLRDITVKFSLNKRETNQGLIDHLIIDYNDGKTITQLSFSKEYDANTFLKFDKNEEWIENLNWKIVKQSCANLPDEKIIEGIINHDDKVIKYLYIKLLPLVRNYIIANSGSEANVEDTFQEALLRIYLIIRDNRLTLTSSFTTFFIAVCKKIWLYQLRKNRSQIIYFTDDTNSFYNIESPPQTCIDKHFTEIFFRHYKNQSQKNQLILLLHFKKVCASEIARIMGLKNKEYAISKKYKCLKRLITDIKNDPSIHEIILENERVELF